MADPIRKRTQDELTPAEGAATPGLDRRVAFAEEGHWLGHVEAAPRTMSGWHHHGDNVTLGYVLKGQISFEFGPGGSESVTVGAGEFFEVPRHTVHREGNAADEPGEVVIVRAGQGPVVFPAEGPEPPSR